MWMWMDAEDTILVGIHGKVHRFRSTPHRELLAVLRDPVRNGTRLQGKVSGTRLGRPRVAYTSSEYWGFNPKASNVF